MQNYHKSNLKVQIVNDHFVVAFMENISHNDLEHLFSNIFEDEDILVMVHYGKMKEYRL